MMYRFVTVLLLLFEAHLANAESWKFECSIAGPGLTVWRGNIFHCPSSQNVISLKHSTNVSSNIKKMCDAEDATIIGELSMVYENVYTSHIIITGNLNLLGGTVECWYDNGTTDEVVMRYTIVAYDITTTIAPSTNFSVNIVSEPVSTTDVITIICCGIVFIFLTVLLISAFYFCRRNRRKKRAIENNATTENRRTCAINYAVVQPVTVTPEGQTRNGAKGLTIVTESNYSYLDFNANQLPIRESIIDVRQVKTLSGCIREEDELLNLDSLLIKLEGKVNDRWYHFGLAIGIPLVFLRKLEGYPQEECIVEILDFWLRNHPDTPTWKEIADAMEEIQDYELAKSIKGVYELAIPLLDGDQREQNKFNEVSTDKDF